MAKQEFPGVDSEDVAWDAQLSDWKTLFDTLPFPLADFPSIAGLPSAGANDDGIAIADVNDDADYVGKIVVVSVSGAYKKLAFQTTIIVPLTDNSTGTSGGNTIGAVNSVATAANAIATLAAKLNALIAAMRTTGAMES